MNNFRKTLAYKICGYSFYVVLVFIIFCIKRIHDAYNWEGLMFLASDGYVMIIYGLAAIVITIVPFWFIGLSITAFITKKSSDNKKSSLCADIGYVLITALTGCCFLLATDGRYIKDGWDIIIHY